MTSGGRSRKMFEGDFADPYAENLSLVFMVDGKPGPPSAKAKFSIIESNDQEKLSKLIFLLF